MDNRGGNAKVVDAGNSASGLDGPALFERIRQERILAFQDAIAITEKHFANTSGGGGGDTLADKLHHRLAEIRAGKG